MVRYSLLLGSCHYERRYGNRGIGGHVRPDTYSLIPLYIQRHGIDAAREVADFELSHIKALQDVIRTEQIDDCDFLLTRNMNVYLDQNRGNETKRAIEKLREMGCGFVDDVFVLNDKDAEAVRLSPPLSNSWQK